MSGLSFDDYDFDEEGSESVDASTETNVDLFDEDLEEDSEIKDDVDENKEIEDKKLLAIFFA